MIKRRWMYILYGLILVMMFSLVGCNLDDNDSESKDNQSQVNSESGGSDPGTLDNNDQSSQANSEVKNDESEVDKASSEEAVKADTETDEDTETDGDAETDGNVEVKPEPIGPISHLTGLPISQEAYDRRPIGIMISNIETAMPQYGVSQADIIYEVMVEGGITRLFALFQDFDADKIGPVRSARHYFLDLALEHDAIYTHVGQSIYATEAFKQLDVDRFYGISYLDAILTFQDKDRVRPHSTFTGYDYLMATWKKLDYRTEPDYSDVKFNFSDKEEDLSDYEDLTSIRLDYSSIYNTNPEFIYNEDDGLYYRYQYGTKHIDAANNEQLRFKNLIVQYVTTWWIKDDTKGCIDMSLVSTGEGMYIVDGKMIPITWSKDNHYATTKYYKEDGSEIVLRPGKTFVSIFPKHNKDKIIME